MATIALRQLLKSLCNNSVWNYAVLWKLRHGSPAILTWEDGYFSYSQARELEQVVLDDACCKGASDILSPDYETNVSNGEDYSVELVVADMSSLQYATGEGIVGKVASEKDHHWVNFTDIFTSGVKCPQEWLLQFASGVKTILLVPVLPHGVLQLGSFEEVSEDINIIAYVKTRFNCLHSVCGNTTPISLKEEFEAQLSSSLKYCPIKYSNALSSLAFTCATSEDMKPSVAVNSIEPDNDHLSTASQGLPLLTVQDAFMPTGNFFSEAFRYEGENENDVSCTNLVSSASINASELEMTESKLFDFSCLVEQLQAYSDCNDYSMGLCVESFNEIVNSYPIADMAGETSRGKADVDTYDKIVSNFLRFPEDCELHKALGLAFRKQPNENLWDSSFLVEDISNTSGLNNSQYPSERTEVSWFAKEADAGYLLEAVVANPNGGIEETSNISNNIKLGNSNSGHFTGSTKPQIQPKSSTLPRDDLIPWSLLTSASATGFKTAYDTSDASKSMISTILSKEQQEGHDNAQLRKGHKTSNISKRRMKPRDNQRPRPRDRQLIQDRVKELRELVPNGAKCSIDSLLDRTVKHMLYLRNATDQAEKLRQCVHQELDACENWRSTKTKDNCESGTSWAFELSNESQVWPILVKDLAHPGYMLIEMLCNDHGLFLEIAEVIRGSELTILKGVQQSRSGNTWARFVVEASKGFHRLDIFWPLMQLLQRKRKPISSKI